MADIDDLRAAAAKAEAAYRKRSRSEHGLFVAPRTRGERRIRAELADAANAARRALWIAEQATKAAV